MGFRQDVVDAAGLKHIAYTGTGLHTGSRSRWNQDHAAAAEPADDAMGNRFPFHLNPLLPAHDVRSVLHCLLDGGRHFVGLAVAARHPAILVTNDHQRVEAEPAATLDHGGATANFHHALFQAVLSLLTISCHEELLQVAEFARIRESSRSRILANSAPSKLQAALAGCIGKRFDTAVVAIVATVECCLVDSLGLG